MKAPSRPRPTWSVALWCEWYMCEPVVLAVNSYVNDAPGWIGCWVMCGTPSIAFGSRWPWKWIPVGSERLFVKIARTRSPSSTSIRGPGHIALNPSASSGGLTPSIWCLISSIVSSKTLTPPSRRGASGGLTGASFAPSPPRNRSTTAFALASWSAAVGEPLGAVDGSALWPASCDAPGADADGAAEPGGAGVAEPAAGGVGTPDETAAQPPAAGVVHATMVEAMIPPPVIAPARSNPRRVRVRSMTPWVLEVVVGSDMGGASGR